MTGGGDIQTLDFYTENATGYAEYVKDEADNPQLAAFAAMLEPGARVLDFGCGPGWAANRLKSLGFKVKGFDGSAGLAEEARRRYGLQVRVGRFEDFDEIDAYDGVWASFCLLHDSRAATPGHLMRLARSLRPGGVLYVGVKEGEGEERDSLGRYYTYFSEAEMRQYLVEAGFSVLRTETETATGFSGVPALSLHLFATRA